MIKHYARRSHMDYRGQPIDKVITDIDTSYNHYGLLTRLDRVLALAKKGFDDADIEYGLRHFIAMCPNKSFQKVLKTTYGVSR